jgi:hypothetical protein
LPTDKVPKGLTVILDPAADVLAFMARPDADDAAFDALALRLFAHQVEHNAPYRRFCQERGRLPRTVRSWRDIPPVPIQAFKDVTLSCVPTEQCERVFMTSGTTRGDLRGRHHHPALQVYDDSMRRGFQQFFMCEHARLPMLVLFPTEAMMPNSSLAHYLALAKHHFGELGSRYGIDDSGLQLEAVIAWLQQAQALGRPVAVVGASYSWVHLIDALQARGLSFHLPAGSRLLDTGGFKGQSRDIPMQEFYALLSRTLDVPAQRCINMYGMTELSTQWYDAGNAELPSIKRGPHWIRWRLIDPVSGRDVPAGQEGIVVHCDLANYNAVTTILTEDVGIAAGDGFKLLGRAQGSQAKGCSIAVDQFLQASRS